MKNKTDKTLYPGISINYMVWNDVDRYTIQNTIAHPVWDIKSAYLVYLNNNQYINEEI